MDPEQAQQKLNEQNQLPTWSWESRPLASLSQDLLFQRGALKKVPDATRYREYSREDIERMGRRGVVLWSHIEMYLILTIVPRANLYPERCLCPS